MPGIEKPKPPDRFRIHTVHQPPPGGFFFGAAALALKREPDANSPPRRGDSLAPEVARLIEALARADARRDNAEGIEGPKEKGRSDG